MFSLIITIIAIALVCALALATMLFIVPAFESASATTSATRVTNQASQIAGAANLYYIEQKAWPDNLQQLVDGGYLQAIPETPAGAANEVEKGFFINSAYAAGPSQQWQFLKDDANKLTYLVLGNTLSQATCGATIIKAKGLKNVTSPKSVSIPTSIDSSLQFQCVNDGRSVDVTGQKAYSFFWRMAGGGDPVKAIDGYVVAHPGVTLEVDGIRAGLPETWTITMPGSKVGGIQIDSTGGIRIAPPLAKGATVPGWTNLLSQVSPTHGAFIATDVYANGYVPVPSTVFPPWTPPATGFLPAPQSRFVAPLAAGAPAPNTAEVPGREYRYCENISTGQAVRTLTGMWYRRAHFTGAVPAGWSSYNNCYVSATGSFDGIYFIPTVCPAGYFRQNADCVLNGTPKYDSDGRCQFYVSNGQLLPDPQDPDCAGKTGSGNTTTLPGSCSTAGWTPGLVIRNADGTVTVKANNLNGCGNWNLTGGGNVLPGMSCTNVGTGGNIVCS